PGSPLAGRSIESSGLQHDLDVAVLRVRRGANAMLAPDPSMTLEEGDELLVRGDREEILKAKDVQGIDLKADAQADGAQLAGEEARLAEVVVLSRSPLVGRSLADLRFRQRFGLHVL